MLAGAWDHAGLYFAPYLHNSSRPASHKNLWPVCGLRHSSFSYRGGPGLGTTAPRRPKIHAAIGPPFRLPFTSSPGRRWPVPARRTSAAWWTSPCGGNGGPQSRCGMACATVVVTRGTSMARAGRRCPHLVIHSYLCRRPVLQNPACRPGTVPTPAIRRHARG